MSAPGLAAWAELSRLSNLPTCLSNVLVGCAIGAAGALPPVKVAVLGIVIMLFYVAGSALNDVVDHRIDRRERPGRPIPSGRISLAGASVFAWLCLGLGLGLIGLFGAPALGLGAILAVTIVAYDLLHKRIAAAVILMGACRALVYLVAAAAVAWPLEEVTKAATLSAALGAYVTVLTWVAGTETGAPSRRRFLALLLPLLALGPVAVLGTPDPAWTIAAAGLLVGWLALAARDAIGPRPRLVGAVHRWLSAICLIDAFYLTLLDWPSAALLAAACFATTAVGHRYILGT